MRITEARLRQLIKHALLNEQEQAKSKSAIDDPDFAKQVEDLLGNDEEAEQWRKSSQEWSKKEKESEELGAELERIHKGEDVTPKKQTTIVPPDSGTHTGNEIFAAFDAAGPNPDYTKFLKENFANISTDLENILGGSKVVVKGDQGPLVRVLQMLIRLNLDKAGDINKIRSMSSAAATAVEKAKLMVPDGDFGPKTYDAVKAVQLLMQLRDTQLKITPLTKVDGKIGRQTLSSLFGRWGAAVSGSSTERQVPEEASPSNVDESTVLRWNKLAGLLKD